MKIPKYEAKKIIFIKPFAAKVHEQLYYISVLCLRFWLRYENILERIYRFYKPSFSMEFWFGLEWKMINFWYGYGLISWSLDAQKHTLLLPEHQCLKTDLKKTFDIDWLFHTSM